MPKIPGQNPFMGWQQQSSSLSSGMQPQDQGTYAKTQQTLGTQANQLYNRLPTPGKNNYVDYQKFLNPYNPGSSGGMDIYRQAQANNPLANGQLGSYGNYQSMFGLGNYPDINNQQTVADLNKWQSYLGQGQYQAMQQYAKQQANAGVAAGRGGYGVQGGYDPYSQIRQQQMGTLANQFSQNTGQAMDYLKSQAMFNQNNANAYLGALGDAYKANLGFAGQVYGTDAQTALGQMGIGRDLAKINFDTALQQRQMDLGAYNQAADRNLNAQQYQMNMEQANQVRDQQRQWTIEDQQRAYAYNKQVQQDQDVRAKTLAAQQAPGLPQNDPLARLRQQAEQQRLYSEMLGAGSREGSQDAIENQRKNAQYNNLLSYQQPMMDAARQWYNQNQGDPWTKAMSAEAFNTQSPYSWTKPQAEPWKRSVSLTNAGGGSKR